MTGSFFRLLPVKFFQLNDLCTASPFGVTEAGEAM